MHLPCLLNLLLFVLRKSLGLRSLPLFLGLRMTTAMVATMTTTTSDQGHCLRVLCSRKRTASRSSWRGRSDEGNIWRYVPHVQPRHVHSVLSLPCGYSIRGSTILTLSVGGKQTQSAEARGVDARPAILVRSSWL